MNVSELKTALDSEIKSLVEREMLVNNNPEITLVTPQGSWGLEQIGYGVDGHTIFLKGGF